MIANFNEGGYEYGPADRKWGAIIAKFRAIRKPVIASMHGAVAGGAISLVLACDFRIAKEDTKFIFAFVNLDLILDMGGAFTLVKDTRCGKSDRIDDDRKIVFRRRSQGMGSRKRSRTV